MEYVKLKNIAKYPTGKLDSNAAVEGGQYPFFTCAQTAAAIDTFAYDGEYVLLGGNNANGNFPVFYYKGKFNAYQRTYLIQPTSDNIDTKYLYYAVQLKLNQMRSNASGTATKFLTKPILDNINIEYRRIDEQRCISSILSAYDDLIENNNKRIKILEQMAENLYKEWFVRFRFPGREKIKMKVCSPSGWVVSSRQACMQCPEHWNYGALHHLNSFKRGKNITAAEMVEGVIPVISAGIEPSGYHCSYNVEGKSLTISSSGANAGYLQCHFTSIWAADCSYCQDKNQLWFIFNALKFLQPVISNMQVGSAQPHVYPKHINKLCTILPNEELIAKYCKMVEPIYEQISILQEKNKNLTKQRDKLLPRLMSGKLEV